MSAATVPGRWVTDDPRFDGCHGIGDEGFCECGKPLSPTGWWVHSDDEPLRVIGLASGWCCPECCDNRWEPSW